MGKVTLVLVQFAYITESRKVDVYSQVYLRFERYELRGGQFKTDTAIQYK